MGGSWDVEKDDHLTEEELERYREDMDRYLLEHEDEIDRHYGFAYHDIRNTHTNGETLKNGDTHRTINS